MLCVLALLQTARLAYATSCPDTGWLLVHPAVDGAYTEVVQQLHDGMAEVSTGPIGVCSSSELSTPSVTTSVRRVVAVGPAADTSARRACPHAEVLPILVRELPPDANGGLSLFVEPDLVLATLRTLAPRIRTLYFVYRQETPLAWLRRAKASAVALDLRWEPIAVDGLPAAARAVETLRTAATPETAVWFHRGVLALNPDILVPPLVRASWERQFPVVTDDADLVERGLLFALTPDYRWVGHAAAEHLVRGRVGLSDIQGVHRVINRRTARAIGLQLGPEDVRSFDHVYE